MFQFLPVLAFLGFSVGQPVFGVEDQPFCANTAREHIVSLALEQVNWKGAITFAASLEVNSSDLEKLPLHSVAYLLKNQRGELLVPRAATSIVRSPFLLNITGLSGAAAKPGEEVILELELLNDHGQVIFRATTGLVVQPASEVRQEYPREWSPVARSGLSVLFPALEPVPGQLFSFTLSALGAFTVIGPDSLPLGRYETVAVVFRDRTNQSQEITVFSSKIERRTPESVTVTLDQEAMSRFLDTLDARVLKTGENRASTTDWVTFFYYFP